MRNITPVSLKYWVLIDMNKYSGGDSAIARAFGAQVATVRPQLGLYLVIGRSHSPVAIVRSASGQVLIQFPGTYVTLVLMRFEAFLSLRSHPQLKHIGPVTLDHVRFEQFVSVAGLDLAVDSEDPPL